MRSVPTAFVCLALLASPATAQAESWSGHATPGGGSTIEFGYDDDGESTLFLAWCDTPGAPVGLWYLVDRELVGGQTLGPDGLRNRIEDIPISLLVDDQRFDFAGATAQPEEMYGGNEIVWTLAIDDPLFAAMAGGGTLAILIDDVAGDEIALAGIAEFLSAFRADCAE